MKRMCPRAHPVTPHEMRQDAAGRWFCPIERDAELEQRDRDRQQAGLRSRLECGQQIASHRDQQPVYKLRG